MAKKGNNGEGYEVVKPKKNLSKEERAALLAFLNKSPQAKVFLDTLVNPTATDEERKQVIADALVKEFTKHRNIGIMIGWQAAYVAMYEKIALMTDPAQIKQVIKAEADTKRIETNMKERYGIDRDAAASPWL